MSPIATQTGREGTNAKEVAGERASRRTVPTPAIWLRRLVKRSPLYPLLRPRRFQAYCVGPAKSGTVSVNGMFCANYRAAHEAAFRDIVVLAIARLEGRLGKSAAARHLRRRDRQLRLEMDSFNQLSVFAQDLTEMFPQARFVLTVREPRSWLGSIMNQHLNVDVSDRQPERRLRELFFGPPGVTYSRGEEELERLGLFPLDGYLRGWSQHYQHVLDSVPRERLLILRTRDLARSAGTLAAFLSIPPATINFEQSHLHRCPRDHGVCERLDGALVADKLASNCDAVLARIESAIEAQPW